jgi:hypothetical protein
LFRKESTGRKKKERKGTESEEEKEVTKMLFQQSLCSTSRIVTILTFLFCHYVSYIF